MEIFDFLEFCRKHKKLYLYGAGKIGLKYLQILRLMGIEPDGFITSKDEISTVDSVKVFSAEYIKFKLSNMAGIIATFKGATENLILENIDSKCDVYVPQNGLYTLLQYEFIFFPFLYKCGLKRKKLMPKDMWKKILVIRQDVLGDGVMTTAFLRELRRNCPNSQITFVARYSNELLFKNCPYISKLALYDFGKEDRLDIFSVDDLQNIEKNMREFAVKNLSSNYDIVFQLCPLLGGRGAPEALMLGSLVDADCHVGRFYFKEQLSNVQDYLYHRLKKYMSFVQKDVMPQHEVACMLNLLRNCGGEIKNEALELWFNNMDNPILFTQDFPNVKNWIALGIVGSMPYQCWSTAKFRQFILEFEKKHPNCGFVLLGGNEATESAREITTNIDAKNVLDLTGKTTLEQVAAVIGKCSLYVGVNTGLMHIAAALKLSIVEISGYVRNENGQENSPMGPWGTKSIVLQKQGLDDCKEICSKSYPHCVMQITVDEVMEAVEKLEQ